MAVSGVGVFMILVMAAAVTAYSAHAVIPMPEKPKEPKFVKPVTKKPVTGTRVFFVADKLTYDARTKIAVATGFVQITYGSYRLTATKVVYDTAKDTLKANGSVELREPNGNILQADYAEVYDKFKQGFAEHLKALLTNDVTITAAYARRYENGITIYEHSTYTACRDCVGEGKTPAWQIVARQTKHDENSHTLYYKDATFELGGVPIAWVPSLSYPDPTVKRRTGFLFPNFSYGKAYGPAIKTPYFWVLAPNADVTFTPMWTVKQGMVADVDFRHRLSSGQYDLHGYGVYQLDQTSPSDPSLWRGAVTSKGDFKYDSVWSAGWDGTLVSDRTFFHDYSIGNRDMITSSARVTGLSDRSYVQAEALQFQTMITGERQDVLPIVFPYVTASHTFAQPILGGELGVDMTAYSLERTDPVTNFNLGTRQTRAVTELHWQNPVINGLGQIITPFMRLRSDLALSQNVPSAGSRTDTSARLLPTAGVDMRWPFLATNELGQSILTPVAQLISAPDEGDITSIGNENAISLNFDASSLFLEDRFTGFDRFEGGTRANAGLLYSFLAENGGFARVSFGESFHLAGQNSFIAGSGLNGSNSDLVGAIALQPTENMRFTYQARVAQDLSRINTQEVSANLRVGNASGALSYADIAAAPTYGRPDQQEQIWGSANYSLSDSWTVFGGFRYDLRNANFMEKSLGVQFSCDCMTASLSYTESSGNSLGTLPDKTIKLSVEFRTLGTITGGFGL